MPDAWYLVRKKMKRRCHNAGPMTIVEVSEAMARSKAAQQGKPEEASTSGRKPGQQGQEPPRKDGSQRRGGAAGKPGGDSQKGRGRGDGSEQGPVRAGKTSRLSCFFPCPLFLTDHRMFISERLCFHFLRGLSPAHLPPCTYSAAQPVEHRASIVQLNDLDIAYEVFGPANVRPLPPSSPRSPAACLDRRRIQRRDEGRAWPTS